MSTHACEAAILTCEDFRLHQRKDGRNYIADFMKENSIEGDIITRAGGVQDLVRPKDKGYIDSIIRDIGVSVNLHYARTVYLINHADCGAYKEFNLVGRLSEIEKHTEDLREAARIITEQFPNITVKSYFGELKEGSHDEFEIKEI